MRMFTNHILRVTQLVMSVLRQYFYHSVQNPTLRVSSRKTPSKQKQNIKCRITFIVGLQSYNAGQTFH